MTAVGTAASDFPASSGLKKDVQHRACEMCSCCLGIRGIAFALIWSFSFACDAMGSLPIVGNFDPNPNLAIRAVAVRSNGNIVVGGDFTRLNSTQASQYLACIRPDGNFDPDFHVTCNKAVKQIALYESGNMLVAGSFTSINNAPRNGLVRLLPTGLTDFSFNYNPPGPVSALLIKPDQKILLAGSTLSGTYWMVQLLSNGSLDNSFSTSINGIVHSIAVEKSGEIILGGLFTQVKGQTRNNLARIDAAGSAVASFAPVINGKVNCVVIQSDSRLLISGDFTEAVASPRQRIARLYGNGSIDPNFVSTANLNAPVESMVIQADGKIIVGGNFYDKAVLLQDTGTQIGSYDVGEPNSILAAVLEKDGRLLLGGSNTPNIGFLRRAESSSATSENLFVPVSNQITWMRGGSLPEVYEVAFDLWNGATWQSLGAATSRVTGGWIKQDVSVPVGGWLRARASYPGAQNNGSMSRLETITPFGDYPDIGVEFPQGTPLADGVSIIDLGSQDWLTTGTTKTIVLKNTGTGVLANLAVTLGGAHPSDFLLNPIGVTTLAPGESTTLSVLFSPRGGGVRSASLQITSNDYDESSFDLTIQGKGLLQDTSYQTAFNDTVWDLALLADGGAYVVGRFTQVNGQNRRLIARLDSQGNLDLSFAPDFSQSSSNLNLIRIQPDQKVLVTGGSISVNGLSRSYLVRLLPDGNLDAGFSYALNSYPKDMHLLGDGRILVIVSYNDATGFPRYRLVRLNSDGSLDGTFDSEATASSTYSYFYNVAVQLDGKILVAGDFSSVGGISRRSIARFNANGTLDTGFVAPPTIPSINSLAIQADGKILLAGKVKIVNSIATDGIIRLLDTGSLDGTFNPANYAGEVLGLQTDGKILMGGGYPDSDLLRLNPDGTRDPYFNVDANNPISCASIGPDGRIFVAGTFTEIGGVVRSRIARLPNNIVATRSLQAVSASEITWNRGGSSPEIQDALFERWNGANWVSLGKATRISGGWSLAGLSLGQGGYIRCRSTVSNHNLGGSGSAMLEEVQLYNLTGFGFSPLQIWRIDHFGNNENIGDGANANDWDLDGVCNLMEFALGTDPRTSSSIPKPASAWEKIEGEDYFTLTFSKPPGATGILYTPQYSEKLVTWGNGSGLLTLFEEADSVLKFGIKRTEASGFMRLSVSEE